GVVQDDAGLDRLIERDVDRERGVAARGEAGRVDARDELARRVAAIGAADEGQAGRQRVADGEAADVVRGAGVVDREAVVEACRVTGGGVGRAALVNGQVGFGRDGGRRARGVVVA